MAWTEKSKMVNGSKVTICLTESEGLDVLDGGKWLLMCEDHGGIVQGSNKQELWRHADEVAHWCEEHDKAVIA